jgi:hypothetical protein
LKIRSARIAEHDPGTGDHHWVTHIYEKPRAGCRPPKCAVRYQAVVQAVAVLSSIAINAFWGLSPEPEEAGPNAEALTGASTRTAGAGARIFAGAGTGAVTWVCLCAPALADTVLLVRDEFVPRLEWKTAMSVTASAAHTSTRAMGQRDRRDRPVMPERAGGTDGDASAAMVLSLSAKVACTPRSTGLDELPASGTNANARAGM